jgi:STAS domain
MDDSPFQAAEIPGVHIFHFASPIHYANAEFYAERLYSRVGCNPIAFKREIERQKRISQKEERRSRKQGPSVSPMQGNLLVRINLFERPIMQPLLNRANLSTFRCL